jgi:hypothetical protein
MPISVHRFTKERLQRKDIIMMTILLPLLTKHKASTFPVDEKANFAVLNKKFHGMESFSRNW